MKKLEANLGVLIATISAGFSLFLVGIIITDGYQRVLLCGVAIALLILSAVHFNRIQKQIEKEEQAEKIAEQKRFDELISTLKSAKDEIKTEIKKKRSPIRKQKNIKGEVKG
jgi:amino acid permease